MKGAEIGLANLRMLLRTQVSLAKSVIAPVVQVDFWIRNAQVICVDVGERGCIDDCGWIAVVCCNLAAVCSRSGAVVGGGGAEWNGVDRRAVRSLMESSYDDSLELT